MSSDDPNEPQPRNDNNALARRLEEIEKADFGGHWRATWSESFERVPPRHRAIVFLAAIFPFGLAAMAKANCPPPAYYLAAIIVAVAIGLLSRDLYNGKHRKTNQTKSRRPGEGPNKDRRTS